MEAVADERYRKVFRWSNKPTASDGPSKRSYRNRLDSKTVGSASASVIALRPNSSEKNSPQQRQSSLKISYTPKYLEQQEERLKKEAAHFSIYRYFKNGISSIVVFFLYLALWDTLLVCLFTTALTVYHYYYVHPSSKNSKLDFVFLSFALVIPINTAIGFAFNRRERALDHISRIKSCSYQMYLSHCIWNWGNIQKSGRASSQDDVDWLQHTDQVLDQLIGLGDELSRFLTLPTSSLTRHRMLNSGRIEAAEIIKLSYRLFNTLYTKRICKLSALTEKLKLLGLSATECSRIRQYERFIGESLESLRIIKAYRTPIVLRVFGRLFTIVLPPLYSPTFASYGHLWLSVCFAILTPIILMGLFEALEQLEDPFVGFVILDGINAHEEFEVLHWHQLMTARNEMFPNAPPFHRPDDAHETVGESLVDIDEDIQREISLDDDLAQDEEIPTGRVRSQNSIQDNKDSSQMRSKKIDFKRMSVHFKTLDLDDLDV